LQVSLERYDREKKAFEEKKMAAQMKSDQAKRQEEFLQTIMTGIGGNEGSDNGFADQIDAARAQKVEAITKAETAKNRVVFLKKQLLAKNGPAKEATKEFQANEGQLMKLTQEVEAIRVCH
jgi:structural maintenance of chromosome 2